MSDPDDIASPSEVAEVDAAADADGSIELGDGPDAGGSRSILSPLMSTEPDVSPREASGAFDPSVPWHKDLEAGLQKITGSGGMPAIGHVLVATLKLAVGEDASLPTPSMPGGGGDDDGGGEHGDDPDVIGGDEL